MDFRANRVFIHLLNKPGNSDKKLVGGQWQTYCVLLEARDDSKTANCTIYRNFPNHEFDCLNTSIRKRTSPQTPEILEWLCTYIKDDWYSSERI